MSVAMTAQARFIILTLGRLLWRPPAVSFLIACLILFMATSINHHLSSPPILNENDHSTAVATATATPTEAQQPSPDNNDGNDGSRDASNGDDRTAIDTITNENDSSDDSNNIYGVESRVIQPSPPAILRNEPIAMIPEPKTDDLTTWSKYRIQKGDGTMAQILEAIQADDEMKQFLITMQFESYKKLRVKDIIYFNINDYNQLESLLYKTSPEYYLRAGRDENGNLWAKEETPTLRLVQRQAGGRIDSSLWDAASAAGLSPIAADQLINVLETQIDLHRDTRVGDSFRIIYDEWFDEYDTFTKFGRIHAFEYSNASRKKHRLIRGIWSPQDNGYYTPEGDSLQRAFLPAPLKYRRISSTFSLRRFHPVLKKWRAHRGVDYAASSGERVYATADGLITTVTKQRGYGNVIIIKHFNIYKTVYAHLRNFARGIKKGQSVEQGQLIGYVGQTGLATGPHLHYEFRVNDTHKDPLSVSVPKQLPALKGSALATFQQHNSVMLDRLDAIDIR